MDEIFSSDEVNFDEDTGNETKCVPLERCPIYNRLLNGSDEEVLTKEDEQDFWLSQSCELDKEEVGVSLLTWRILKHPYIELYILGFVSSRANKGRKWPHRVIVSFVHFKSSLQIKGFL